MSSIHEIEAAIEKLPAPQVEELAAWLETLRARRATATPVESWLQRARGAALPSETTANVVALRFEEVFRSFPDGLRGRLRHEPTDVFGQGLPGRSDEQMKRAMPSEHGAHGTPNFAFRRLLASRRQLTSSGLRSRSISKR